VTDASDRIKRLGFDPRKLAAAAGGADGGGGGHGDGAARIFLSRQAPVAMSSDLARVLALPRRSPLDLQSPKAEALAEMMTTRWRRDVPPGDCPCGCGFACRCREIDPKIATINPKTGRTRRRCLTRLKPAQAWVLYEIGIAGGVLASLPVGTGKTLVNLLSLLALHEFDPSIALGLALVPPSLLQQLYRDARLAAEHLMLPQVRVHGIDKKLEPAGATTLLHVLPYSRLSLPTSSDWVRNLGPDAIIADECDRLKDPQGAGSSRILRAFIERGDAHPMHFCGWTGSLTDHSLTEFAHLAVLALRESAPVPLDKGTISEWARAVDAVDTPAPPGELRRLCDEEREDEDPATVAGVRAAFGRRLAETMGFVISTESSVEVDLTVAERPAPPLPAIIQEALHKVRTCWVRPDTLVGSDYDEELTEATEVAKVARELASGIFYRWRFPFIGGQPQRRETIKEWKEARRDWNRELRVTLKSRDEWLDSPHLCELAAQRFHGDRQKRDDRPEWASVTWPRWRDVKALVKYETEACRVSDYLAADAATWALADLGIVWYGMVEFGQWVAEISGLPMHGGGPEAEARLIGGEYRGKQYRGEVGDRSIVASIKSHGRGRDGLQALFSRMLIAQPPSSATQFEQVLGRLERDGQQAPSVTADYYAHTPELASAIESAVLRAEYVQQSRFGTQKLLRGSR